MFNINEQFIEEEYCCNCGRRDCEGECVGTYTEWTCEECQQNFKDEGECEDHWNSNHEEIEGEDE